MSLAGVLRTDHGLFSEAKLNESSFKRGQTEPLFWTERDQWLKGASKFLPLVFLTEWTVALLLVLSLCTFREIFKANHFPEQPPRVLGHVDEFNDSDPEVVAYTPVTHMTQRIMNKMAMASFMTGRTIIGTPDEDTMDRVFPKNDSEMVGIVFTDTFSYRLKFPWGHRTPDIGEHFEYSEHWWAVYDEIFCPLATYWQRGFVAFPTAMNAAVIEHFRWWMSAHLIKSFSRPHFLLRHTPFIASTFWEGWLASV